MQTVSAADANRHFSNILKQVSQGKDFLVVSRGKPVATIEPVKSTGSSRIAARGMLLDRLERQEATGVSTWSRDELYRDTP